MKKNIAIVFLIAFIVPTVASASWWNPSSWFKKNVSKTPVVETESEAQISVVQQNEVEGQKTTSEPKTVEKIVEKPVIQTITVQDPVLQIKINALISENENLKKEILKLKEEYGLVSNKINKPSEEKPAKNWCSDSREDYYDIQNKLSKLEREKKDLERKREEVRNSFKVCGTLCNSELIKLEDSYSLDENELKQKESQIKEDIAAYCD